MILLTVNLLRHENRKSQYAHSTALVLLIQRRVSIEILIVTPATRLGHAVIAKKCFHNSLSSASLHNWQQPAVLYIVAYSSVHRSIRVTGTSIPAHCSGKPEIRKLLLCRLGHFGRGNKMPFIQNTVAQLQYVREVGPHFVLTVSKKFQIIVNKSKPKRRAQVQAASPLCPIGFKQIPYDCKLIVNVI